MKTCTKCKQELPLSEFYILKKTNRPKPYCKKCGIKSTIQWQRENKEKYNQKCRNFHHKQVELNGDEYYKKLRIYSQKSKNNYKDKISEYTKAYKKSNIEKYRAQNAVYAAIKKGIIIKPNKCSLCGSIRKIMGHHNDYNKPLEVTWTCYPCHHLMLHPKEKGDLFCASL